MKDENKKKQVPEKHYTWEQINQAFLNKGLGAKVIVDFMFELNKIHRNSK